MRWGNKFGGESQNNSPPPIARKLNEDSSFTFTKKDEKSPVKDISKTITEESKIEELEIKCNFFSKVIPDFGWGRQDASPSMV